eukprot:1843033-Prymnesium_polylepis.1
MVERDSEVDRRSAGRLVGRLCALSQVCPAIRPVLCEGYAVTRAGGPRGPRLWLKQGSAAWRGWLALLH